MVYRAHGPMFLGFPLISSPDRSLAVHIPALCDGRIGPSDSTQSFICSSGLYCPSFDGFFSHVCFINAQIQDNRCSPTSQLFHQFTFLYGEPLCHFVAVPCRARPSRCNSTDLISRIALPNLARHQLPGFLAYPKESAQGDLELSPRRLGNGARTFHARIGPRIGCAADDSYV
jgi:hypothetical protein